jgi:Thymidylate synthase complementing protein
MKLNIQSLEPVPGDPSRVLFLLPSEGEATAEDLAMIQAMYSRDPRPIDDTLKLAKADKSGEFMSKFYVGYGHDSIAESGSVVIAIENVPMPVAKLIQHFPRYIGQECSTRYLDFSKQAFSSLTAKGGKYQERLRTFYLKAMGPTFELMLERHNLQKGYTNELRAAKVAAFDVLRGFLPCGAQTNLSWTVNLRDVNERLEQMTPYCQAFPDLGFVLEKIGALMAKHFPNTFKPVKPANLMIHADFYPDAPESLRWYPGYIACHPLLSVRKGVFPYAIEWASFIDFASWRDLARHRSVRQTYPRLTTKHGFEPWYLDNLPKSLLSEAVELVAEAAYQDFSQDVYAIPMGFRVPFLCAGYEDKFRYIINLRSRQKVHPTLRKKILELAKALESRGFDLEYDANPEWVVSERRGAQTIERLTAGA